MSKQNLEDIKLHIKRIKGQMDGVEKMIDEQRDAISISQQISAVRSALAKLATEVLKEECDECFKQKGKEEKIKKFEELVSNFFKIS